MTTSGRLADRCSPQQERMWFLQQLAPGSGPAHNVTTATRIHGPVEPAALRSALESLCQRHELLRTRLVSNGGAPTRVVEEIGADLLELRDAGGPDLDPILTEVAMTPFDLGVTPLWRCVLVRLGPAEAVVIMCLSHAIADGWSVGILHRELSDLYAAALTGAGSSLTPLGEDFSDWVAQGDRRRADDGTWAAHRRFWREYLAGAPDELGIPTDYPRPTVERYVGDQIMERMSPALADAVTSTARAVGATPFSLYAAGFAVLLARWAGQPELVIGTPWANRRSVEQERVVGPLMELLLLRLPMDPQCTVGDFIRTVRKSAVRAMGHGEVSFDEIVADLRPQRSAGRNPIFQAMFLMQNAPLRPITVPGASSELLPVATNTARLDLALDITPSAGGAIATFEYNTDLYARKTIAWATKRYRHLVEQIVADPARPLADLSTMDDAERRFVVAEVNRTAASVAPPPTTLTGLIDDAATSWPDRVALAQSGTEISYSRLREHTNHVAAGLAARGVVPGDVVGILAHRCPQMVLALLATMKAGAAYLPMDPHYPLERLREVIADAGVRLVVTTPGAAVAGEGLEVPVVEFDELAEQANSSTGLPALPEVSGDDTAYVIYTSGSTGRPKGVMVSHRSALNYLGWAQSEFPITATDVVVGKTPFTFDISVWEMLGTLAWGARLELVEADKHRDAQQVATVLADSRATVVHFVPSMLRALLALPQLPGWPHLRLVFVGGEAFAAELAGRLAEHTDAAIVNFYGPTEATIYASWQVAIGRVATNATVPIGGPVANTTMYVLDAAGDPVPVGVAGELYLGGPQVAQGYLGRPGLTARQFRPDPFTPVPGARMYRTGDQVRRCGDGTVDFLGRVDGQIKLRGYRIELGEVEAALRGHPLIDDAAAAVRGEILVAHVVPVAGADPDVAQLRGYLTERLPAHLIPARFGIANGLPHTTSGKLDRRAVAELALPAAIGADPGIATRAPAGPVELAIAESWSRLLGAEVADAGANFFALGGDSISCVAVVADLARRGLSLRVADIFQSTSLAALARLATTTHAPDAQGIEPILVCVAQRRLLELPAVDRVGLAGWPTQPAANGAGPTDADQATDLAAAIRRLEQECAGLRGELSAGGARIRIRPSGSRYGLIPPPEAEPVEWLRTTVDLRTGHPWGAALRNDCVIIAVDSAICDASGLSSIAARLVEILREQTVEPDPGTPPQPGPIGWRAAVAASSGRIRLARLADPVIATTKLGGPRLGRITTVDLVAAALARTHAGSPSPGQLFVVAPPERGAEVGPDPYGWWVAPGAALTEVRAALRRPVLGLHELDSQPGVLLVRVFDPRGALAWTRPAAALAVPEWVSIVLDVMPDRDTLTLTGYGEGAGQCVADLVQAYPLVVREATDRNAYVAADFPLARLTEAELMVLSTAAADLVDVLPLGPTQRYAVDRVLRTKLEGLYAVCFTLALTGRAFDVAAWRSTWQELMRRHPGLRTSFWLGASSGPVQLVHANPPLPFVVDDLRDCGRAQALAQVAAIETAQRLHVTDVTDVPQWQMRVIQIDDDDYRVLCRLTYLLQDGWSVSVLQHEWYPLYDAFVAAAGSVDDCPTGGARAGLPPPAHSYARQLEHLATRDLAAGRRYWSQRLVNVRTGSRAGSVTGRVAETLRSRSRPEPGLEHQTVRYACSPAQEQALRAYARAHQLTLFTPLQGAWALTVAGLTGEGLTGESTVLFGTISSGRDAADIRRTYGSFNSMMPTAVALAPQQSCNEFLRGLQAVGSTDRANDHVSLTEIAADLGLAAVDLLDTYIVLENFPMDLAAQTRFQSWQPDIAEMRTEHALRMLVWPVGELSYHVSFDARFISAAHAAQVLHHFVLTLTRMIEDPQAPLAQLITDPLNPPEGVSYAD